MSRFIALFALTVLLTGTLRAEDELPGLKPGTVAPPILSTVWTSADGKAPELKGKVYLIDFYFAA